MLWVWVMSDVAEVKEAIEWFESYGPDEDLLPHAHSLADAARRWIRMVSEGVEDECLRCDGLGYWEESNPLPGYSPGPPPMECPYCNGSGRVLVAAVGVEKETL